MNSNFQFLQAEWSELFQRSQKAEQLVITDPRTSLTYARMALELAVNWMYQNDSELELPYDTSLNSLMKNIDFKDQFSFKLYNDVDAIRKVGNMAIHNKSVSETDSDNIISNLYYFAKWFAKSYSKENIELPGIFDGTLIPTEGQAALSKKQIDELQGKFEKDLNRFQTELKLIKERNQKLEEENELYKRRFEELQAQINQNKVIATEIDETKHPRNEKETRQYYIDVALREAGWDLSGARDKEFKVDFMPESTNKSTTGYVDYVLWDDDGTPLALVEAKKSMENASKGENQAQLYADALEKMYNRRPIMFYTNGFETYIWDDQFYKKARLINGFYTKAELQTAMFRRTNRQDIRTANIDTNIVDRSYQMRAIKSIAEHIAGNDKATGKLIGTNRGALLVLATGTGKTRTAIAFSKVMLENNWAKRILFLADRKSLVSQAKRNFVKLLPEHKSVNLLEEKDNPEARLTFSTYQTMMGMIDNFEDEERTFGVGHFDLIIIDEAHRSIYKKYQAIFEYFDAILLGLTATPKQSIDRNTYAVFGLADQSPTDAYTFKEAVANNHLVPYRSIEVPTKFLRKGIRYSELSETEKEEFENEILEGEEATGNEHIPREELDSWLFNKDTAIKTLRYIIENGIKKRGGEELGKTIIFARNKKHAHFLKDIFLELDKELYSNEYVKVITHGEPKAEEFIKRFCDEEKERLPQIAISVDMMDTGIDAPSCVNLVFYKPVKSYAKFWQMIGRGSRLRENLFGQGEHKDKFLIFDLFGNFEFFEENPQGIESSSQSSLTEVVFNLKLDIAQMLKESKYTSDAELQTFRTSLLDELFESIASLDHIRFDVKMKIKHVLDYGSGNRELWNHLEKKDIKIIKDNLSPLVKPVKGDSDLARFYDRLMYTLIQKRITLPNTEQFISSFQNQINKVAMLSKKLLRKMSIPEVKKAEDVIKEPLQEEYWKTDGITHLENVRISIRNLIKYIDQEDQRYATTNFEDVLYVDAVRIKDQFGDLEKDDVEVENLFPNNQHRLEELIRNNQTNVTINRIRNGEQITHQELESLEAILFSDNLKKDQIEREIGKRLNLVQFIIGLMGLSPSRVNEAFADFINEYQLNSTQIQFLDTIKLFLTENGSIAPYKLYEGPFKKLHNQGIDGVFDHTQSDKIFSILELINSQGHSA